MDGRAVGLTPGVPFAPPPGSTIDTRWGVVRIRTASGDEVELSLGSHLRSEGTVARVERLLLLSGGAEGRIGDRTSLGTPAGWIAPPSGASAEVRVEVAVRAARDGAWTVTHPDALWRDGTRTRITAVRGAVGIRCGVADVWLPEGAGTSLEPAVEAGGPLGFGAPPHPLQRSQVPFEIVAGRGSPGETSAEVPPGLSGCVGRVPGTGGTRWSCASAPPGVRLRVGLGGKTTARPGADLAPGVACIVDERGRVQVEVPGASPATLKRLLALEAEFRAR